MPHILNIESLGIVISLQGAVTGEEIFRLNRLIIEDERFSGWRYQIWDFSDIETIEISFDQLRSFVFQDSVASKKNPHHRIAIITRNAAYSGLDSVFHLLAAEWGGYASKTFRSVRTARKWVNTP